MIPWYIEMEKRDKTSANSMISVGYKKINEINRLQSLTKRGSNDTLVYSDREKR
jgi:hypothetical protein